jgi:MoaA/NifB/PqqE/SkfB family radical SAM enzyme
VRDMQAGDEEITIPHELPIDKNTYQDIVVKRNLLRQKKLLPSYWKAPCIIMWDITHKCNLRCVHCYNYAEAPMKDEFTSDQLFTLGREIVELKVFTVCLTGGEPLLRKEYFDLATLLTENKITVGTVSNGMLITEEIAKKMKESGIFVVQISIDGGTAEDHDRIRGVKGSFERAVNAVRNLRAVKFDHILASFIPMKTNIDSFPRLVELCLDLGVETVRTQPFVPIGRGFDNRTNIQPSQEDYKKFMQIIEEERNRIGKKDYIQYGDPIGHIRQDIEFPNAFCEILSNGDVKISPYLPFTFGNVREKGLRSVWMDSAKDGWQNPTVKDYVGKFVSVNDLSTASHITWIDDHINVGDNHVS